MSPDSHRSRDHDEEVHSHEPNPDPPAGDASITLAGADATEVTLTPARLQALPSVTATDCHITSTGHGQSGPFEFRGPALLELARLCGVRDWTRVRVAAGDGFGALLKRPEVEAAAANEPVLLALERDGEPLTRTQGFVRLIVPYETENALKQVKWVRTITFRR